MTWQRAIESVTGIAPAFSVRETAFLLLEDTDKNCRQMGEVEVVMHARVTSWEYRGPPPLLRIPPFSEELAAASTHGAPAEAGPADNLAIIDEGALCYRRVGCPTVATLWPL